MLLAYRLSAAPQYFLHLWQTEDGLPQNAITAIVQTRDGYLWIGTYSGLARFDGVRFVLFDNNNTPELQSSRVTCLYEDAEGGLWIGHETGEVTRFSHGHFSVARDARDRKARRVFAIGQDEDADIWFMNEDGLLTRLRDGLALVPPSGNAPGQVAFTTDRARRIWVARQGKLSRLEHGKLLALEFPGEPDAYVQGICASADGGVWVASDGKLREWFDGKWTRDMGTSPWGLAGLSEFLELRNGLIAAGTIDSGFYIVGGSGQLLQFNRSNGFPQNWIRSLCEDREGNLWVGAGSAGLVALREGKVAAIQPPDHWQGRVVTSLCGRDENDMWIGTEGAGLYHVKNGQWEQFRESAGLANGFVWSVAKDRQDRVWAGTWGAGVFVRDASGKKFTPVERLQNLRALAILHTADGVTWIGSDEGLIRYQDGKASRYGETEGLDLPQVRTLAEAPDGALWFGMFGGGLGRLTEGNLKQFRAKDGLSSDFVQCLKLERDGTVWAGTSGGGLTRVKEGRFSPITRQQGLMDNVICHIEEDDHGYFWISSHGGIMRISKAELNACADGKTNRVNCLTYGKGEGMPTLECSGGMQPSGCATDDGRFWFPTSKGLVVVNPKDVKRNLLPPPVVIESFLVDDKPQTAASKAGVESFTVPPGRHRFDFYYTGLSLTVPEKVRFRYRLEGLDPDWVDAGTKRSVNYSYIPPGQYRFRVLACNNDGVWSPQGATAVFRVLPQFWQTWWFAIAASILGVGVVGGLVLGVTRARMKRKFERLERQRAIERERARIAKDIHDDLGASLTRITMLSQSARAELEQSQAAASDLDRIYDTAREMTRAMDEIVWAVNPQHDTLDSLATYLGRFAQGFLACAHVRCRLDVPMQLPAWPLTAEIRHNLFLAFKEALHNAVRHSKTAEVRISVSIENSGFTLRVEDKGCGFEPNGSKNRENDLFHPGCGNGLGNMRQRLEEIGGHCDIKNGSEGGAIVEFVVPVKLVMT